MEIMDVTVFGAMPYEGGRRQIGMYENGDPVWGTREQKGSFSPNDKPYIEPQSRQRKRAVKKRK